MTTPKTDVETTQSAEPGEQRMPLRAADLEILVQKLKLLQFGLYGLQQYGRNAPVDVDDIGPFYRLAEEIESDVLELQRRLASSGATEPPGGRCNNMEGPEREAQSRQPTP